MLTPTTPARRALLDDLLNEYRGEDLAVALDAEGFAKSVDEAQEIVHRLGLA